MEKNAKWVITELEALRSPGIRGCKPEEARGQRVKENNEKNYNVNINSIIILSLPLFELFILT